MKKKNKESKRKFCTKRKKVGKDEDSYRTVKIVEPEFFLNIKCFVQFNCFFSCFVIQLVVVFMLFQCDFFKCFDRNVCFFSLNLIFLQ